MQPYADSSAQAQHLGCTRLCPGPFAVVIFCGVFALVSAPSQKRAVDTTDLLVARHFWRNVLVHLQ